jgi:hypothetical protein
VLLAALLGWTIIAAVSYDPHARVRQHAFDCGRLPHLFEALDGCAARRRRQTHPQRRHSVQVLCKQNVRPEAHFRPFLSPSISTIATTPPRPTDARACIRRCTRKWKDTGSRTQTRPNLACDANSCYASSCHDPRLCRQLRRPYFGDRRRRASSCQNGPLQEGGRRDAGGSACVPTFRFYRGVPILLAIHKQLVCRRQSYVGCSRHPKQPQHWSALPEPGGWLASVYRRRMGSRRLCRRPAYLARCNGHADILPRRVPARRRQMPAHHTRAVELRRKLGSTSASSCSRR